MSRAGVARTIGVVLAVLVLAGCGQDATWQRAIGRWGNGSEEVQIAADGTGVYWTRAPIETRQFRWTKETVEPGTYRLTLTFDGGSKQVFLAQPKAIDELVLLTDEKQTHAIMSPVAEKDFAKPENAIHGRWATEDGSKVYLIGTHLWEEETWVDRHSTRRPSNDVTITSPGKNQLVIEVERDGAKETLTADYDPSDGALVIRANGTEDRVFRRN